MVSDHLPAAVPTCKLQRVVAVGFLALLVVIGAFKNVNLHLLYLETADKSSDHWKLLFPLWK